MDFFPFEPIDENQGQKKLWSWIKDAFKNDEGVAYYRYPIFTRSGSLIKEPDILLLHRKFGLWVFECKGCYINNIQSIQGHQWEMNNWYEEIISPIAQAEDQMFAIKNKFEERRESRGKLHYNFRVALPKIEKKDWIASNFNKLPSTGCVLVYEDLTTTALKYHIEKNSSANYLDDETWKQVKNILGGTLPEKATPPIQTGTSKYSPLRVIQKIESSLKTLDKIQQKAAYEIPAGPQRLRGLAGTGKTVLFAKRAAKMHIKHPEWIIGFVFFSQSLYEQIRRLITIYYQEMHPDGNQVSPNWKNLRVLHTWGGKYKNGFYYDLSLRCELSPKTLYNVKQEIGQSSPSESFQYICDCLEKEASYIPVIYDALLIDEGQDLPPIFYQLAYKSLSDSRRLYWAYDEAQGVGSLTIPSNEAIWGRKKNGKLLVDLSGKYDGGISKSHIMSKCYRTPRSLLMAAHSINMGLFRNDGALQGVTTKKDWEDLGYKVIKGDFRKAGEDITITRLDENSPHPIDSKDFGLNDALGTNIVANSFNSELEEQQWIVEQISDDINRGLMKPEDILITAISGDFEKKYFESIKDLLKQQGISGYIAGIDGSPDIFWVKGSVTISSIYRAKGNEAWKVYACRFNYVTQPLEWKKENELHKRNEAFVALTRAKVWCMVTGLKNSIFNELQKTIEQGDKFTFPAFNKHLLQRRMGEISSTSQVKKAEKAI